MGVIRRFLAIFVVAAQRLLAQRGLSLATSLGIIAAVALSMSIPIYADAVYQDILETEIAAPVVGSQAGRNRPPFAFMFRYIGSWSGPLSWDQVTAVNEYLTNNVVADLGLPSQLFVRYFRLDKLRLFTTEDAAFYKKSLQPLDWVSIASGSEFEQHVTIVEGSAPVVNSNSTPAPDGQGPAEAMDVMINEALASELGLQVGESYVTFGELSPEQGGDTLEFPIRIVGVFKIENPSDPYWFYSPSEFGKILFIPETNFITQVVPYIKGEISLALWYYVLDGSSITSNDVPSMLARIAKARQSSDRLLPGIRLDVSPEDALLKYWNAAGSLRIFLYAFSIPLLSMILTFIGLVGSMSVDQRRNEIAVLRSRGATLVQILGIASLEGVLLGAVGLGIGAPAAQMVAIFFGKTRSFLDFSADTSLKVQVTEQAFQFGLAAVVIALVALILPSLGAAQHTIVTYKQERARQLKAPFWQRAFMDFLLLIPAAYGIYLLRKGGLPSSVLGVSTSALAVNDPFQNPLLMLVPALGIFSITLIILRFLPFLMRSVAWVLGRTKSVGILMATRHLARSPGQFNSPLILLVITLSLSTFTATMAQTLDNHLYDQSYYFNGSDVRAFEFGDQPNQTSPGRGAPVPTTQSGEDSGQWIFLPVYEHLKVPGITAAARVAETAATIFLSEGRVSGVYMGIDRVDFGRVAFWRRDFASQSLGGLMNNLALTSEGLLVSRSLLSEGAVNIGDTLRVTVTPLGEAKKLEFKVVGIFDYFPTWYPEEGPLLVGNLDYFFEAVGGEFPYNVWLRTIPDSDYVKMEDDVQNIFFNLITWEVTPVKITTAQLRPERQGLFGLLSVGFTALALLTVLGFLLYALFSFRRRFIELGMLRAIGLSAWQMMIFLSAELAFLLTVGLAAGTGLGVWISNLFIPFLQIGEKQIAHIPPYLVQVDWSRVFQIYILFGLLFLVALTALAALLLRMKIFQAVKMGEAV